MKILVTAGNTQTPLDKVRCITNIFSGRTGARVALEAYDRGHAVTLLTSHPEVIDDLPARLARTDSAWEVRPYHTFEDLESQLREEVAHRYDAIIHAAAVSDYQVAGVFTRSDDGLTDAAAGKVKSTHSELWLKLAPAPKLIDKFRRDWGFAGTLVKFKLEVGASDAELLDIAERSRLHSQADLMCANTLEGMADWAYLGSAPNGYHRVTRSELAPRLLHSVERLAA